MATSNTYKNFVKFEHGSFFEVCVQTDTLIVYGRPMQ